MKRAESTLTLEALLGECRINSVMYETGGDTIVLWCGHHEKDVSAVYIHAVLTKDNVPTLRIEVREERETIFGG